MTDPIDSPLPPSWIEEVRDVTEKSAVVTVIKADGQRIGYLIPRRALIEPGNGTKAAHANGR